MTFQRYYQRGLIGIATAILGISASTASDSFSPLSQSCERELALSAAPAHLRDGAGVMLLGTDGFYAWRKETNNFTCVVNRDDPRVLKPICFDAEGTETILPKIVYFGEQLLAGDSVENINAQITERFEKGDYISPRRPGVAYMLSRYNRPVNQQTGELGFFPPHVMFYAPNLTVNDIGHDMASYNPEQPLPMIGYQGPHGYMIMISDDGAPRSRADLPSCPTWVFE